jgi:hypothetical protein
MTRIKCGVQDCTNNHEGECTERTIVVDWGRIRDVLGMGICQTSRSRSAPIAPVKVDDVKGD